MIAIGLAAAAVIGVVLGALGGGGSILTVPVLVYIVGTPAVQATAYSLFVVGVTAAVGAVGHIRSGNVDLRTAALFAPPSLVAVFVTRRFLVPAIPDPVFHLGSLPVTRETLIMTLFALTMLVAAVSMIRGCKRCVTAGEKKMDPESAEGADRHSNPLFILIEGAVVGVITGIVGAGGGFLIIPALVLVGGLPMKRAVGTSLLIIAAKSLIGFSGDLGAATALDWGFLLPFTGFAVLGIIGGVFLARSIDGARLRPAFGWLVLGMGTFITVQQLVAATPL